MTLFLTGSPTRFGDDFFTSDNGFLDELLRSLPEHPRVLMISAAPDDSAFSESVLDGMGRCIRNSGIVCSSTQMLDRRNAQKAPELVSGSDWIILCGGHVPTQNAFLTDIRLSSLLRCFDGVVMGCSAGSMNCAAAVYSHPELPSEALDPHYRRFLKGLGLTDISIVPHLEQVRHSTVDGLRLFEDIIFPDSRFRKFYTFRDGGYIFCREGHCELRGEGYEISDGSIRQVSTENKSYTFMNFIFISPNFPRTYSHFCSSLKANGVNVLAIADCPWEELAEELRSSITEYYRVNTLESYEEVFRAVAYFSFKYGHIDWLESNNEYWLEQDARLRTDFNISTGIGSDRIASIKNKSEMKKYYALGGIPTARQIKASERLDAVLKFAETTGYPLIAKPDNGVGAEGTYKFLCAEDVRLWFSRHKADFDAFVVEEFITGLLVSYDGIFDSKGDPVFENMNVFPTPIMDIVNDDLDNCYYTDKTVPAALSRIGRKTVKAFGITRRFVHLEFFRLDSDRKGLGKKGDYVGLEVNMRPAGGYTPDMMNYAHSTDVYQIWADMVAFDQRRKDFGEQYYCAYASRRNSHNYLHSHEDVIRNYSENMCMCENMPSALSSALGDISYIAKFSNRRDIAPFFEFVTARRR